jgi:hypothetical protein
MLKSSCKLRRFLPCLTALALAWAGLILAGCASNKELPDKLITFDFQTVDPQAGLPLVMPISGIQYHYITKSGPNEVDLDGVQIVNVQDISCLLFSFSDAGLRKLARETALHQGLKLFTFVNGHPIGVTPITRPINDGQLYVFVEIPEDQLQSYVKDLQDSITRIKQLRK